MPNNDANILPEYLLVFLDGLVFLVRLDKLDRLDFLDPPFGWCVSPDGRYLFPFALLCVLQSI